MANLIELLGQQLTPDTVDRLARVTGEQPANVQAAVQGALPALLCGISSRSTTPEGSQQLLDAIGAAGPLEGFSTALADREGTLSLLRRGAALVSSLFGLNATAIADALSAATGVSGSSAANLLSILTPLSLGAIGSQFGPDVPPADALANVLADAGDGIRAALPAGLADLVPCASPAPVVPAVPPAADTAAALPAAAAAAAAAAAVPPPPARPAPAKPAAPAAPSPRASPAARAAQALDLALAAPAADHSRPGRPALVLLPSAARYRPDRARRCACCH